MRTQPGQSMKCNDREYVIIEIKSIGEGQEEYSLIDRMSAETKTLICSNPLSERYHFLFLREVNKWMERAGLDEKGRTITEDFATGVLRLDEQPGIWELEGEAIGVSMGFPTTIL